MPVFPHLNPDELRERMKTSATVRQRLRWQVIFLAHQGQSSVQIAQTAGYISRGLQQPLGAASGGALQPRRA